MRHTSGNNAKEGSFFAKRKNLPYSDILLVGPIGPNYYLYPGEGKVTKAIGKNRKEQDKRKGSAAGDECGTKQEDDRTVHRDVR